MNALALGRWLLERVVQHGFDLDVPIVNEMIPRLAAYNGAAATVADAAYRRGLAATDARRGQL